MSEDMLPYCSAHDKWLIMKLCMYVGYHDANNVSNFGGDFSLLPVHTTHLLPFLGYFSHFRCHPILSFLILSNFLTPDINLNTVIPTTPNFFACTFLTAHVSASYVTIMYISPDLPVDSFLICRNKHTQIVDAE